MTLIEEISKDISEYCSTNSLGKLVRYSGVSKTTIKRLKDCEVAKPSLTHIWPLMAYLKNKDDFLIFMFNHYPNIAETLKLTPTYDKAITLDANLIYLMQNECYYHVFHLACTRHGTDRMQIERLRGKCGLETLDTLLNEEILVEDENNKIYSLDPMYSSKNPYHALSNIKNSVNLFKVENIGTDKAILSHQTESVNEEALKQIKDIIRNAAIEIAKVKEDDSSKGDIPFAFSTILTTLND